MWIWLIGAILSILSLIIEIIIQNNLGGGKNEK